MKRWTLRNAGTGALIYASGDSVAAWLSGEFQLTRSIGMLLIGGTLYAIEIPTYFAWLDRRFGGGAWRARIERALLAQAFFNPLWIARHLAWIFCVSGRYADIGWSLLSVAWTSFVNIAPFAIAVNYLIQNHIPLHWRFLCSALFSAAMAVYYASSERLFA
ncbi:MAG: hypothetical protein Kow0065_03090 [Methylomicrobium sp.]